MTAAKGWRSIGAGIEVDPPVSFPPMHAQTRIHMATTSPRFGRSTLVLLFLFTGIAAQAQLSPLYRDPTQPVDARVGDLLQRMTLEEKVAQLQGYRTSDPNAVDAQGNFVGGKDAGDLDKGAGSVWARGPVSPGAQPIDRFAKDAKAAARRFNSIQKYMREKTRLGIPVFVFAEALHGYMASGATSFPQAIALGSTWDVELVERVFGVAALEARARGVNQVLSPVLDLARDARWGRFEECYGEDPYLVSRIGMAAIFGLQGRQEQIDGKHVAVTLKHFAGHGQPEGGRNIAPVNYSEREFRTNHLYPFEMAVKFARAHTLMASYNEWDGVPNHLNRKLLTDILRKEWGFKGYVQSDGGGMEVVYENHLAAAGPAETGILCMEAGLDYCLGARGRVF